MFQDHDEGREFVLGNKQLLGLFFVLVVLLGVFFAGGYMVGRSSLKKGSVGAVGESATAAESEHSSSESAKAGETHAIEPEPASTASVGRTLAAQPQDAGASSNLPLGTPKRKPSPGASESAASAHAPLTRSEEEQEPAVHKVSQSGLSTAAAGHTYIQVVALGRPEAEKVAKVLLQKGFSAQLSPKPGSSVYRVLVGPVKDAGDLNATRDALKSKGFRQVFVQRL